MLMFFCNKSVGLNEKSTSSNLVRVWLEIDKVTQNRHTTQSRWNNVFSLACVDASQGEGLRGMFFRFLEAVYGKIPSCVDLASETFTGHGVWNELPTDWVKSELLETFISKFCEMTGKIDMPYRLG